jgi:hypothetical protein
MSILALTQTGFTMNFEIGICFTLEQIFNMNNTIVTMYLGISNLVSSFQNIYTISEIIYIGKLELIIGNKFLSTRCAR